MQDAAHRLYGAAEDVAEALVMMLEIDPARLRESKARAVSQQGAVGRLLLNDHPDLPITGSIKALIGSAVWASAMSYRGRLVHEQPPLVGGLGIVHRRQRRWRPTADGGRYLAFGGGDAPEFDIAALMATCGEALGTLLTVWDDTLRAFMDVLEQKGGIVLKDGTLRIPDYFRNKLRSKVSGPAAPGPDGTQPPAA